VSSVLPIRADHTSRSALSDEQLQEFIAQGFLIIETDLPNTVHDTAAQQLLELTEKAETPQSRPCNNLLPLAPSLETVLNSPALNQALSSILGADYILNGHKALQPNYPRMRFNSATVWHRDAYFADYRPQCVPMKVRDHFPWSLIVFYTPIDILEDDIGPTDVVPGSQYCSVMPEEAIASYGRFRGRLMRARNSQFIRFMPQFGQRAMKNAIQRPIFPLYLKKGAFTIMHHDMWHAGTFNITDRHRTTVKFEFSRCSPPKPDRSGSTLNWTFGRRSLVCNQEEIHHAIWGKLRGQRLHVTPSATIEELLTRKICENAVERSWLNAIYGLANLATSESLSILTTALANGSSLIWRGQTRNVPDKLPLRLMISHALEAAVPQDPSWLANELAALLKHQDAKVRGYAVRVFTNTNLPSAHKTAAIEGIISLANDSIDWVRGQVAVGLGRMKTIDQRITTVLIKLLSDKNEFVRQYAAQALIGEERFTHNNILAIAQALNDDLRDVKYFAMEALMRSSNPLAWELVRKHLRYNYWCAASAKGMPY
jgi:HEAT repeat protein/ectoine hydroxylase-related dioxygenase (phytanoyl-CoA dioxygenase family)